MTGETSEKKTVKLRFEPDGIEIRVPAGTFISKAAVMAGCGVETPCGGMGTCGKCRVEVTGNISAPDANEKRHLGEEDISRGVRLACRTRLMGDAVITVPASSRSLVQKILSSGVVRDIQLMPYTSKHYVELSEPTLEDERAEFERLADALKNRDINLTTGLGVTKTLAQSLRSAGYKVTAVISGDELVAVEPGDTTDRVYGMAFDLGSTTIVGYLMDLRTGAEIAVASGMNAQMAYGDDLVSRINYATTEHEGAKLLQSSAVGVMNRLIRQCAKEAGVAIENIYEATVVGNTCMTHLLMGIDVSTLGQSPYVPSICTGMAFNPREISLDIHPNGRVQVLPNVAGFVGSDLVAVMLASMWEDDGNTRLAVDIGTNGEMALRHNGKTYSCSAAAGPAFEGARISCGMRGAPGAIDSVAITDKVTITAIDNKRPIGLCGSGLLDAVAQMLEVGIVDETGRMVTADELPDLAPAVKERLVETDEGIEFVLATASESGTREPITLKQRDVRQLQLAKGSIHAAIQTLLKIAGTDQSELSEILLAGAFGNYIRKESAVRIGLIPDISQEKIVSIGNAAGAGAKLALLSHRELELAQKLAKSAIHIELATHPDYQYEFMERMMFLPSLQLS